MSKKTEEREERTANQQQPPPEPIYDLTTSDKTEFVKAAGPRERGDEE